jgi:hypothetical protein
MTHHSKLKPENALFSVSTHTKPLIMRACFLKISVWQKEKKQIQTARTSRS